jgi:hypothetical protein
MDLSGRDVHDFLTQCGVGAIYHANSVQTSCQFIRAKALLSRGTVANRGLRQTPQPSDAGDKRYGVWFDVFADHIDIHNRGKSANSYGPVLFELDIAILREAYVGGVWITKSNPIQWNKIRKQGDRWFQCLEDYQTGFNYGQFDQMLVLRHCGGELHFDKYLRRILLDDPKMGDENGPDFFGIGFGALQSALTDSGLDVSLEKRFCDEDCKCIQEYLDNQNWTQAMFLPAL